MAVAANQAHATSEQLKANSTVRRRTDALVLCEKNDAMSNPLMHMVATAK
jgi:hypothetical protein